MLRIFKQSIYLPALILVIVSCKSSGTKETTESTEKTPLEKFSESAQKIQPSARSGADIAVFFELSGADYNEDLVADPLDWKEATENEIRTAAKLGVYTTDALYQYALGESDAAYLSWMAAKSLSRELGIDQIFDTVIINRVEQGVTPQDSIVYHIDQAMLEAELVLPEEDRLRIYTALLTGLYIEKMHIISSTIWEQNKDLPDEARLLLVREMLVFYVQQLQVLNELIALIEEHETLEDPGYVSYELKKMRDVLASMDLSYENVSQLTADQVFENSKQIQLKESIEKIRGMIVHGIDTSAE